MKHPLGSVIRFRFNFYFFLMFFLSRFVTDMAQLINVRLSRVDAQPWGLRLQGGMDFGTPLVVQKVSFLSRSLSLNLSRSRSIRSGCGCSITNHKS